MVGAGSSFRQAFGRNPDLVSSLDPGQQPAGVTEYGGFLDTLLELLFFFRSRYDLLLELTRDFLVVGNLHGEHAAPRGH
jgi:hypothetical protein